MLQPGFTAETGGGGKRKETEIDRQRQKQNPQTANDDKFIFCTKIRTV